MADVNRKPRGACAAHGVKSHAGMDCSGYGACTVGEYYMVRDDVWQAAQGAGMLCIGCVEERLGRTLVPADFLDCPLNTDPRWRRSPRLQARLGTDKLLASMARCTTRAEQHEWATDYFTSTRHDRLRWDGERWLHFDGAVWTARGAEAVLEREYNAAVREIEELAALLPPVRVTEEEARQ